MSAMIAFAGFGFSDALFLFVLALAAAVAGGAVGGILVGGKDLGRGLAAMLGSFFGPVAVVPGIIVGIVLVGLIGI